MVKFPTSSQEDSEGVSLKLRKIDYKAVKELKEGIVYTPENMDNFKWGNIIGIKKIGGP